MRAWLALVALIFAAWPAAAQTTSGSWADTPGGATARGGVQRAGVLFWQFTSSSADSVSVRCDSPTCLVCLNPNPDADGTGAAAYYVRHQPEGGAADFDDAFRVKDSTEADVLLNVSKSCVRVTRGTFFGERSTACDATTCYLSILGLE